MGEHKTPARRKGPRPPKIPNWLFYGVVIAITVLWAGFIVLGALTKVQMPESLNTVFPMVVVTVLGSKAVGDARNRGDDE